ncbi:MAG: hypothetical protein MPJ25_10540, partial [Pirellulales bacterium]|nr:hypothetical protein [Pirellulales bacterium]
MCIRDRPNMAGFTISGAALTGAPITVGGSAVTIADNGVITIAANPTSVASQTITVTGNFVEDADASNTGTFTATIFIRTHTIHYVVLASTMATDFVTPADSDIQTDRLVSGGTITLQNSASNNFARLYLDDTTFTPNIDAQGEATTPHFESQGFLILPDAFTSSIGGRSFTQYEFRSARPVTLTITNR